MSELYHVVGQMLATWSREDAGRRKDPFEMGQEIVDLVIREMRERGFISLNQAAAHDGPEPD